MDAILDSHFQRVENALSTLIDSITKYNPSISAASDLLAADEELSHGLEQRKCLTFHSEESAESCSSQPTIYIYIYIQNCAEYG
jgi:hypothetical protein